MAEAALVKFVDIFNSAQLADLTLTCDDAQFKVHRQAVHTSTKLAKHEFDEIEFPGVEPDIMARVILFMYGLKDPFFEVDPPAEHSPGVVQNLGTPYAGSTQAPLDDARVEDLKITVKVYILAARLKLDALKSLSVARFISQISAALSDERAAEPLRTMYEHTRSGDVELRFPVTKLCIEKHGLLTTATLGVLQQHESWVTAIPQMSACLRKHRIDMESVPNDITMAFIRGVNTNVDARYLREQLEIFDDLRYFDVSRPREAAYVEFWTPEGFAAAIAANPIRVGTNLVYLEARRPRPNAYGGANYEANKAANKAKRDGRQAVPSW